MRDFYERFYRTAPQSSAHQAFCERVFGADLCQHGFADLAQLDALIAALMLRPGQRALDLGCGNGMISEHISDRTGAHVVGIDYVAAAIAQAAARTATKRDRLTFVTGDLNALELPPGTFDAIISIDSLYFCDDLTRVVGQLAAALVPDGQMALLYAHGWAPWTPPEQFDARTLAPGSTPLGAALTANGLRFTTLDLTAEDARLAHLREAVLDDLRSQLEEQDLTFVYENRIGDARGTAKAIAAGLHRRYLYRVRR
jgi:SAM-dependent methyltransferase